MIEALLGSQSKEQALLFIVKRGSGYARQIATYYNCSVTPIKNQLEALEVGGVLISETIGKSRIFSLNPRYPFLKELLSLIEKVVSFLPPEELERLQNNRRRPRRSRKPL